MQRNKGINKEETYKTKKGKITKKLRKIPVTVHLNTTYISRLTRIARQVILSSRDQ